MNKKRRKILIYILLLALTTALFSYLLSINVRCKKLLCLYFPGKNEWKTEDVYIDQKSVWKGLYSYGEYKIRVYELNNISKSDAENFTKITIMTTKGLFDTAKNPYAGVLSDKIVCPESLKPVEDDFINKANINIYFIQSFLNSRLQYGACTETQISYKVYSGTFYCDKIKNWFQIEIIAPLTDSQPINYYKNMFNEVVCK